MKIILMAFLFSLPLPAFAADKDKEPPPPKDFRQPLSQERTVLGR